MAGQRGLGTTFEFEKSGAEETNLVIGNLTSIGEVGADADEIDVTTLDSTGGYREYIPGFKDAGEIALSGYFVAGKNHDKIIISIHAPRVGSDEKLTCSAPCRF